jgi:hypothetical protein
MYLQRNVLAHRRLPDIDEDRVWRDTALLADDYRATCKRISAELFEFEVIPHVVSAGNRSGSSPVRRKSARSPQQSALDHRRSTHAKRLQASKYTPYKHLPTVIINGRQSTRIT